MEFFKTDPSFAWQSIGFGATGCIHLFPKEKNDIFWGHRDDWYDGPQHLFGLGRLMLFTWADED